MIRYIAVTESADQDESRASHIPESQIERIDRDDSGKAVILVREYREEAREGNNGYGTREWRVEGQEVVERYSVMKFDDLIAWLNGIPRPLMLDIGPEEAAHIKRTLEGTRRTLDSIRPGVCTVTDSMLESDVNGMAQLLEDREWAEHCTTTKVGGRLESAITVLMGHNHFVRETEVKPLETKLQRAEQLLAEIYHAVNNDGWLYPVGPDSDLVARLSEYLYPDPVANMDRIGSQAARDILDE